MKDMIREILRKKTLIIYIFYICIQGAACESSTQQQGAAERWDGVPQEVSQHLQGPDQPGCGE